MYIIVGSYPVGEVLGYFERIKAVFGFADYESRGLTPLDASMGPKFRQQRAMNPNYLGVGRELNYPIVIECVMATFSSEQILVDTAQVALNVDVQSLEERIKSLRKRRTLLTSNIIISRSSQTILKRLQFMSTSADADDSNPLHTAVTNNSRKQLAYNQECLYRICSGVTTFIVKDPDPYSIDKGAVLGIRIDAFQSGRFVRPYYVFLNGFHLDTSALRVHRHTVPPYIPLEYLAKIYLPTPIQTEDALKVPKQDLSHFVKALRSRIVAYHNRIAVIASMRRTFRLNSDNGGAKGKGPELTFLDISAADAEARHIRLEWLDGRIGRAVVSPKGMIVKCVVIGEEGRDRTTERTVLGGDGRIEGMAGRLVE